ncbi:hypothetical protein EDC19_2851 [Natranaerovirga hydrolytica]|uniref:DUF370 domain-containing protein n=1 Tax=Natranaerovirga hydrolytica TaxID=680378 RepID=A0A4R1M5D1_9FIRM|nr:DUF370 domain-containing protein [Natranaerovirga hydrolytica]TCK86797.1 hypothetical protein EDC19_2851 [Natranaerovirga hydrolytica]
MYIHIGEEKDLLKKDIIGIYDFNISKNVLSNNNINVIKLSNEKSKSIVIEDNKGIFNIYLSPISSVTLYKRWNEPLK